MWEYGSLRSRKRVTREILNLIIKEEHSPSWAIFTPGHYARNISDHTSELVLALPQAKLDLLALGNVPSSSDDILRIPLISLITHAVYSAGICLPSLMIRFNSTVPIPVQGTCSTAAVFFRCSSL